MEMERTFRRAGRNRTVHPLSMRQIRSMEGYAIQHSNCKSTIDIRGLLLEVDRPTWTDIYFALPHHWSRFAERSNFAQYIGREGVQRGSISHCSMAEEGSGFSWQACGRDWNGCHGHTTHSGGRKDGKESDSIPANSELGGQLNPSMCSLLRI